MNRYEIDPKTAGDVCVGGLRGENVIWAGQVAERGSNGRIYFDGSDNFVVLQVGKRGSGKSYGMGALLESFATRPGSEIGRHTVGRAVLLLDPLDIHWTALEPVRPDGPPELARQYGVLSGWPGLNLEPINSRVFVPAGFEWEFGHPAFETYYLPVQALDSTDWAYLLTVDLVNEPRGRLLDEVYRKVTTLGWQRGTMPVAAKASYEVADLIDCAEHDAEILSLFHTETRRSLIQPLRSFSRMPLFSRSVGTPLRSLLTEGTLAILCLGRLPAEVRSVLATVLIRKLRHDRMIASQIKRRLSLHQLSDVEQVVLREELGKHVPRTILAIDEAQILMPSRESSATRRELDAFVLEGRNYGLSLWMATQRPKGAISPAAVSQIDTFIVHRLSVREDIDAMCGLLQNALPEKIRLNGRSLDLSGLIRSLEVGQAVFSSAQSNCNRLVVGTIRPRMVAHGGEGF
jgi:uncharacterized protein